MGVSENEVSVSDTCCFKIVALAYLMPSQEGSRICLEKIVSIVLKYKFVNTIISGQTCSECV